MRTASIFAVLLLLIALDCGCATRSDESGPVDTSFSAGPVRVRRRLESWKTIREKGIVMQSYDFSCGSAALATLMRYYFQDDVTEREVLENMLNALTDEQVRQRQENGLTMLDLKQCAERMGYQAVGVRLEPKILPQLQGPVLIHLQRQGYKHFAVLRGVRGDRAYVADPSSGNVRLPMSRFLRQWTNVALVLGKPGVGLPTDYPLAVSEDWAVHDAMLAPVASRYLLPDSGAVAP
ncbi:MAG: C39 family peptidase [Sedimentisphaerales bacterium]|jgi:predicted double-glycine peptidase|nr:C39 family peptidase [Sedimentisphaerales bacterium]HNY78644.1 C39 family peptidase [Sedimentisphaerales bacterium]HOC64308.1 C39 family peptidase [Sedimentisphaerales bacterium]HOH64626.1 C39 family peptidase [Sedimentisphaerales bacterium]HPY49850.1 C39 family peptidase [Sedimentisphaerales bacterium]